MTEATWMLRESLETADVVRLQLQRNGDGIARLGESLRDDPPALIATCARGSSDHMATWAKYLFEMRLGLPVTSTPPSVSSVYGRRLALPSTLFIAVSQSGRSPDLLAATRAARASGARTVAVVNDEASPLAELVDVVLPISAGVERSVAATKSCIGAATVLYQLAGEWIGDADMLASLQRLPRLLLQAQSADWTALVAALADRAGGLFVLGRGPALGVAQEMALKLKETCGLHAEALSSAEVLHGPMAIVGEGFPVLALIPPDPAAAATGAICDTFAQRGAQVLRIARDGDLPLVMAPDAALASLLALQSFYPACEALARRRGFEPDAPPHLRKVTQTR